MDNRSVPAADHHRPNKEEIERWEDSHYCNLTVKDMLIDALVRDGDDPCVGVGWLLEERQELRLFVKRIAQSEPGEIGLPERAQALIEKLATIYGEKDA